MRISRLIFAFVAVLAGPIALSLSPMPLRLALACLVLGIIAGALCWTRHILAGLIALCFVFLFGVDAVGNRLAPNFESLWWEPAVVAGSAMVFTYFVPDLIRRVRRKGLNNSDART